MKTTTLKTLRQQKGWSQQELGNRVGVSQYTVSRWEKDPEYLMDTAHKYILKLAEVLGVKPEQIDMGTDKKEKGV